MIWNTAAEVTAPEDTQILIHANRNNRIEFGLLIEGKWYLEIMNQAPKGPQTK